MSQNNPYGGPPAGPDGPGGQAGKPGQGQPGQGQPGQGQPGQGQPGQGQPGWNPGPSPYPGPNPAGPPQGGGYAFGPFAPGPTQNPYAGGPGQPQGFYPGGPGQPPPGAPGGPPAPPKRRSKLPLILGAAVLALILIGIGIAAAFSGDDEPTTTSSPGTSQGPTDPPSPAAGSTAEAAVTGYLQAVANGDLAGALAYGVEPPTDKTLLTQKAFDEARKRAPLTDITVDEMVPYTDTVNATYAVGGKKTTEGIRVQKVGDIYKLEKVASDLDVGYARLGGLPLLANGVKVTSDTVSVLPGSYSFTTGKKYTSYGSKSTVVVTGPTQLPDTYALDANLNSSGKKAVIAATKKSFDNCLKQHKLNPKNCPFELGSGGFKIKQSTIKWKRTGSDPFKKPRVSFYDGKASVTITYKVSLKASCTGYANCTGKTSGTNTAVFDMRSDKLSAKWSF